MPSPSACAPPNPSWAPMPPLPPKRCPPGGGVGRPEGKAGLAERKLGETGEIWSGVPPRLRLGVSGTEAQPCSITSLAQPRGQGPRGREA